MHAQRITGVMDGKVTPIGVGAPQFSSAETPWAGFLLEGHTISASREEVGWSWHSTHVGICKPAESVIEISGAAGNARFKPRPSGSVFLFPRDCDKTTIRISGSRFESVVVELDRQCLQRLLHDDDEQIDSPLLPKLDVDDPQIVALIGSMQAEVQAGCPTGSLYAESLSLALAAYLAGRYAAKALEAEITEPKFTRGQLTRILDYVNVHIARDFSLVELASTIQMSPRHFSRLFRNSFATTPCRFVLTERINQAKVQLGIGRLSIIEIAESLGFANQSHFTDVFRKVAGVTPRRYQLER